MRMKSVISLALLLCGALVSCVRRQLEDPDFGTTLNVKVNISAIANVSCKVYNSKIPLPQINPEVMRVLFYDIQRDKLVAESFISDVVTDSEGKMSVRGNLSILPGDYRMIIYQFGTESTQIDRYESYDNANAYTGALSEEALRALQLRSGSAFDGQTIRYQPDHIIAARSEHENIPYHAGVYTITAEASSLVESYYLQVKVNGLQWVSSAKAVLSSMVPSVNLSTLEKDCENPCAIYTPLLKSDDNGTPVVCNVFNTFGRIPGSENELRVTFDIKTVDGRSITKEFEISDLFESDLCRENHWLLIDEVIDVPKPPDTPSGGGGFEPTVDDWEREEHEIEI